MKNSLTGQDLDFILCNEAHSRLLYFVFCFLLARDPTPSRDNLSGLYAKGADQLTRFYEDTQIIYVKENLQNIYNISHIWELIQCKGMILGDDDETNNAAATSPGSTSSTHFVLAAYYLDGVPSNIFRFRLYALEPTELMIWQQPPLLLLLQMNS